MTRQDAIERLEAHRKELAAMQVKSLSIFGSVARGEGTADSDVDVLVEFQAPVGLFGFIGVKQYLERLFGCAVDLGTADTLREPIRSQVLREAVRVA